MKIKITSDSTCDLSDEILEKYNISIVPLNIEKGGALFKDSIDIFPEDIFKYVNNGGELPKTSAVNPIEYKEFFDKFTKDYDAIIHINIGSGFSSCYQNASITAMEYENVFVVDSKNITTGQGNVVLEAAIRAENNNSVEDILKHLENLIPKIKTSFILDNLEYLAKGGRCSSVIALGSSILKLKPTIEVENGKMIVGKKYRGSFKKVVENYMEDKLKNLDELEKNRVFITTTIKDKNLVENIKNEILKVDYFEKTYDSTAGCTISCHCGENTLGIVFIER